MKAPSLSRGLLYLFLSLVARKIFIAFYSMNTVRLHWDEVSYESMVSSESFQSTVSSLPKGEESYVLILNQHALNMTLNWLCNTHSMPGVHNKSLIVTLDQESADHLRNVWPTVKQLNYIVPSLKNSFNYGDGYYQLFYLFRSNLARALLSFDRTFWMIQQDTYWADSLDVANTKGRSEDIIFDRASEGGPLIAGGYYRARPTKGAKAYFERLSRDISWWYAPDNAYMTSLCELSGLAECGGLPFSLITNWQWLDSVTTVPPSFIQFDGETQLGGKLAKMKKLGFYFLKEDGKTCDPSATEKAKELLLSRTSRWSEVASFSHRQFKMYQNIVDQMYSNPVSAWILNRWVLPYAHFCMLTL